MNLKTFNYLLLLAIALTLGAMTLPHYLPKKRLVVIPNPQTITFLYSNREAGDPNHSLWVDQRQNHWRCVVRDPDDNLICSFNFLFHPDTVQGVDLSAYSGVNIALKYTGNAPRMRIHIRSFDERFSTAEDTNSSKFHFVTIFTRDFDQQLYIGMHEFRVADWWLSQYNLPRQLSFPDFRKSLTMGFDFEDQLLPGTHDIVIEKIEFVGEWISSNYWYPGIMVIWLTFGATMVISRLVQLHRQNQRDRKHITQLNWNNRTLLNESEVLKKLSTTDALTGALNRYGLDQYVARASQNERRELAVIIMDIDHFKRINDRRGHDVGDNILKSLSLLIQQHVRDQDIFGRWGGEEFILLCPNASATKAFALAEKIRILINNYHFGEDKPLLITASFGVGVLQAGEDFTSVFKRVDTALYRAKTLGRNCTVMAKETLDEGD